MTRYRLTVLTPLLAGDGQKLAPIDYMVWKDQVNVLDQRRIFRLLARGPRLETYLNQIRRAEKLDFASWGGYAQNYASRRIPFEHPSLAAYYARTSAEHLFIPTFAATAGGAIYVPGSVIKGALRRAVLLDSLSAHHWKQALDVLQRAERAPRRPAGPLEEAALGPSSTDRLRSLMISDSDPLPPGGRTRICLLRTATLVQRGGRLELGWKMSPRGAVESRRPGDSTPHFAEMAMPGTVFEGTLGLASAARQERIRKALRWNGEPCDWERSMAAANRAAAQLLALHRRYAEATGLRAVADSMAQLEQRLEQIRAGNNACLLCIGWGTGLLSKSASLDTASGPYHELLRLLPVYREQIRTGLPFPKTRQVVFLNDQPAALPGWVEFAIAGPEGGR
ncbi:MAG: type III-A CRISPR-associated RAMP protein Csm5 [Bryobacteraceae bacterium]|nr:type III-A CRISPR-associated RAMP protein Csm5 [Bryobacteraceae bacterium]